MRLQTVSNLTPLRFDGNDLVLPAAIPAHPMLVLDGWVDWADGSTFLGLAQSGKPLTLPKLEAQTADGRWHVVYGEMGMPAGKPKTIAVDLSGKLPEGARRLRITANIAVHWTGVGLGSAADAPAANELPAVAASLRFRGFSRALIDPARKQPEMFFYADPSPASMWNPTRGTYSHYGSVMPLLSKVDDRMVIMGSGDELALQFDTTSLPLLRQGDRRSFVLVVDGWAKDQDPNTAFSQTVEPLPFHGMSGYPYGPGERFPDSPAHREWRERYQTRPALKPLRPLSRTRGASE
jgi:hypothetical protein